MTLREACDAGRQELDRAGIPDAALDAWYLLEYVTGITRTVYFAEPGMQIADEQYERYRSLIKKRTEHIPLQHLTGEQEFMGLRFLVNENVLIPRQDTEILVETALKFLTDGKIPAADNSIHLLDMCTGSGCILISVLYYLKRSRLTGNGCRTEAHARGTGADISEKALAVAEENAARHHVEARFVQGDLFANVGGRYGMILSNPPYIRTAEIERLQDEVRMHDPIFALDGKEDGLYFYRRIVKESRTYLEKGGMLIFEIGYDQAREVTELMIQTGFSDVRVRKDLAGLDRVVYGRYDNEWKG